MWGLPIPRGLEFRPASYRGTRTFQGPGSAANHDVHLASTIKGGAHHRPEQRGLSSKALRLVRARSPVLDPQVDVNVNCQIVPVLPCH
jgi:hypothetical protein